MSQIKKKFILENAIDESKIRLSSNGALRARNAAGSADVELMKLDGSDKLQLLVMPEVASDAVSANQLVRKSQLDSAISEAAGDITALEGRVSDIEADYGVASGLATLGVDGKIPSSQLPAIAITDVHVVANIAARDALTVEEGDIAKVSDAGAGLPKTYIYDGASWIEIESGSDVDSVNGYTGVVTLTTADVNESGDSRYYTAAREEALEDYADAAVAVEKGRAEGVEEGLQDELDATQVGAGLEADGSYVAPSMGVMYIGGATSLKLADEALDVALQQEANDRASEDLLMLKRDGSRQMTGNLDLAGNDLLQVDELIGATTVSAYNLTHEFGGQVYADKIVTKSSGQLEILASGISMNNTIITGVNSIGSSGSLVLESSEGVSILNRVIKDLADPTEAQHAATKSYVDGEVTTLEGRVDALEAAAIEFKPVEKFVVTQTHIDDGYVTLSFTPVQSTMRVSVDRLALHPVDDYTVSGAQIHFAGSLLPGQDEALQVGDVIRVSAAELMF